MASGIPESKGAMPRSETRLLFVTFTALYEIATFSFNQLNDPSQYASSRLFRSFIEYKAASARA